MPRGSRNLRTRHLLWVVLGFLCCAIITFGGIVQVVHTHPEAKRSARLRALPHRPPGRSTGRSATAAAHCLCRSQGLDCLAAEQAQFFCNLPSSPGLRLYRLPTLKQFCLEKNRIIRRLHMRTPTRSISLRIAGFSIFGDSDSHIAQSNAGTISGTVTDPTGAVIPWSDGLHREPRQWASREPPPRIVRGLYGFSICLIILIT